MYAIGIDIGGMSMKIGLVDKQGKVLSTYTMVTNNCDSSEATVNNLIKGLKDFILKENINKKDIVGIGVGCPGAINSITGIVDFSNNLNWKNVPLKEIIESNLNIPVRITNDANAATLGEAKFGCGKEYKNVIMLTLGTGVGSGIVIDGKLYEGNEGKGAELGHTVLALNGLACTCGRKGCVEVYASATALMRQTRDAMLEDKSSLMWKLANFNIDNVNGKIPFDAHKANDPAGVKVVNNYVMYLGEAINNFCNIFRPDAIVLSGGVAKQGEYLTNLLTKYCKERYFGYPGTPEVKILTAILGYQSGIIGAASLFL